MSSRPGRTLWVVLAALGLPGACDREPKRHSPPAMVAATNSYLQCAARDLMGDQPVLRLTEPGTCPGHFDIRPSQIEAIRRCRILLRFDFQASLDRKFEELVKDGLQITEVRIEGGLCEPTSYVRACRQIGHALVACGLLDRGSADARLEAVEERMTTVTKWARKQIDEAGLRGVPVIASGHQAAFCQWLGLDVTATFSGPDTARPSEINAAIRAGQDRHIKLVVANVPEGRKLADTLAERLAATVVGLDNFPAATEARHPFEEMLRLNVARLVRGASG